jgi:hypothetical protein
MRQGEKFKPSSANRNKFTFPNSPLPSLPIGVNHTHTHTHTHSNHFPIHSTPLHYGVFQKKKSGTIRARTRNTTSQHPNLIFLPLFFPSAHRPTTSFHICHVWGCWVENPTPILTVHAHARRETRPTDSTAGLFGVRVVGLGSTLFMT